VTFIVHMADGTDIAYEDDDQVRYAPDGSETVTMEAIKEAKQRELDQADALIEREQEHLAMLDERMQRLEDMRAQREERQRRISEREAEEISEAEALVEGQ
jgi:hypothetical protein